MECFSLNKLNAEDFFTGEPGKYVKKGSGPRHFSR